MKEGLFQQGSGRFRKTSKVPGNLSRVPLTCHALLPIWKEKGRESSSRGFEWPKLFQLVAVAGGTPQQRLPLGLKARRALLLVDLSAFSRASFFYGPIIQIAVFPFYAFVPPSSILTLLSRGSLLCLVARCGAAATPASIRPKGVAFFLDGHPVGWSAW